MTDDRGASQWHRAPYGDTSQWEAELDDEQSNGETGDALPASSAQDDTNGIPSEGGNKNSKQVPSQDDVPFSQRLAKYRIQEETRLIKKRKSEAPKPQIAKKRAKVKQENHKTRLSSGFSPSSGRERRWTTLHHSGVLFPPAYEPHNVKMKYKGVEVTLTPEQEEVATFFGVMLETDYISKEVFRKNFWEDFKQVLGKKHVIKDLDNCDFTPIFNHFQAEKERKKQMTKEEKQAIKEEKEKVEQKYKFAIVDGKREQVGNFRVEPPGLFRGRGEHPKMGKVKARIWPEDVTINIGKESPIPPCPIPGHKWGSVQHDQTVTWLAGWKDPVQSKEMKYVWLAANSTIKGESDLQKYEKARKLKGIVDKVRKDYKSKISAGPRSHKYSNKDKQIAVAIHLIDRFALRVGGEKDTDEEADTVGCCTLKVGNVILKPDFVVTFDFLGKDSIRYENTVTLEADVYKCLQQFQKGKKEGDLMFDEIGAMLLNEYLSNFMKGLTGKVFRTYNASITLDRLLQKGEENNQLSRLSLEQKLAEYQRANKEVAILCNHQRSIPKAHGNQMEKLTDKKSSLQKDIKILKADLRLAKQNKLMPKPGQKRVPTVEQLTKKLDTSEKRLKKMELDITVKDELKTVALGTSKINYMDPRITVAWCKRNEVPIEKGFNKSLLGKFKWAMDVQLSFQF